MLPLLLVERARSASGLLLVNAYNRIAICMLLRHTVVNSITVCNEDNKCIDN